MNDFLQGLRNGHTEKPRTPKTRKNFDNSYYSNNTSRFNSYGSAGHPSNRPPQMKRPMSTGMPQPPQPQAIPGNQMQDEYNTIFLTEIMENLANHIDIMVKNQEYMITVQERTADLLQNQSDTIEAIMAYLNISQDQDIAPGFEDHYESFQPPDKKGFNDTVEDLLKAEMAEEERQKAARAQAKGIKKRRKVVSPHSPVKTSSQNTGDLMSRDEIMNIINTLREKGATYDQVAKHLIDLGQPTFSGRGEWHAQTIHRLCSSK